MNDMTTEYVAAFDAGTTALKGALVNGQGCIVASASSELDLIINGDYREQSPDQWWQAFCSASRHMIEQARQSESEFNVTRIRGIIFSGQMQDVIVLNGELNPVRNAILYSDGRAEEQAKQLAETYQGGAERFLNTVGNRLEGCLPLPKLMWLREHEPETYARIRHVLISSKDYLIAQLTGECVGDVAACSTAGAMNIRNGQWNAELCEVAGIDMTILPHLHNPQDNIGTVTESAAQRTGFPPELRYTRALETRVPPHLPAVSATLVNTTSISAPQAGSPPFRPSRSLTSQVLRIWHLAWKKAS